MPDPSALSEAKRALLEKHLAGKIGPLDNSIHAVTPSAATETSGQRESAVMVQVGKTKRPFFYLPGDSTERTFYCYPLAHNLGEEQPFYILEPYTFDGLPVPPSFEEMATAHLKRMRTIQPAGPYQLGGWCNGGLIAYEMARQLYAQGQTVELLVLMDPDPPAKFHADYRIITIPTRLLRLNQEKQFAWFLRFRHLRLFFHFWRLHKFKHKAADEQNRHEQSDRDIFTTQLDAAIIRNETSIRDWERIFDWMASSYVPRSPYPGKLTFFWTSEEPTRQIKWRKWLGAKTQSGAVEVYIILGNHITSRTDHLSSLAEQLRLCIENVHKDALSKQEGASL